MLVRVENHFSSSLSKDLHVCYCYCLVVQEKNYRWSKKVTKQKFKTNSDLSVDQWSVTSPVHSGGAGDHFEVWQPLSNIPLS